MINKGQKINNRYEIVKAIGEGGMANVYLAHDLILNRDVAVKVLRGDLANDEKFVRRFQREALASSSLSHPNIVEMYDVGEDNGTYYIVMEYVDGKTLKQLIKKRGALTLSECIDIMLQLTDGVEHAHESYIIHRDLKPQNIMIQDNGEIKITDFGIAMALNNTQLTQTNSVMGSVHYLPPEQASGKGSTVKSDVYSMGILFYELLTGKLPFRGDNAVEIALKQIKDEIPSVKETNPAIPQSIENIVMKATAKNPRNRYASSKEMHEDLLTALNEERKDEEKIVFKYSEHDISNEKKVVIGENAEPAKKELIIDDEEDDSKTSIWLWILSGIFLLIVIALIVIFVIYPKLTEVPDVKIPEVAGLSVQEAEAKLKEAGFEVALEIEYVSSEDVTKGLVVKTSPSIGRLVKKGQKIILYESTGSEVYEIENYVGKNYIEVKTILENNYGLNVVIEKIEPEDDKEYGEQEIIKQDLEVGTKVSRGSNITLYIPDVVLEYPDFTDGTWTVDDIQKFGDEYKLKVTFKYAVKDGYEEGEIISQTRAAKTPIVEGVNITITVATKKQEEPEVEDNENNNEENKEDNKEDNKQENNVENNSSNTSTTDDNKEEENKEE